MSFPNEHTEADTPRPDPPTSGPVVLLAALAIAFIVAAIGSGGFPLTVPTHQPTRASLTVADAIAAEQAGDLKEARRIFMALAEKNNSEAEYRLGAMWEVGTANGAPDIAKAVSWYQKAADAGIVKAKARLGHLYLEGVGIPQDFVKARALLEAAADDGDATAQFDLARMWEHGWGGAKNLPMAYGHYELAAEKGNQAAADARDALLSKLTPDEVKEGQEILRKLNPEKANS